MSAVLSDCGRYRYTLTREWMTGAGTCLFIMLNPSTADAEQDDPTIRRCIGFAQRWGYQRLTVGNIYAFRATDPRQLGRVKDPVGPENFAWLDRPRRGPKPPEGQEDLLDPRHSPSQLEPPNREEAAHSAAPDYDNRKELDEHAY